MATGPECEGTDSRKEGEHQFGVWGKTGHFEPNLPFMGVFPQTTPRFLSFAPGELLCISLDAL